MENRFDLVAVGESLIDFVCTQREGKLFLEGNPGGAPANVLAMAARLGHSTALVSKVGDDPFGEFLRGKLDDAGVETRFIPRAAAPTTLAIVQLDETGNRSFSFYRDHTADVMLEESELPLELLRTASVLHFGSVSLTAEPARTATLAAARAAREAGVRVAYDPNLRPPLWRSLAEAKQAILDGMVLAHYIKLSEEELVFLTGKEKLEEGLEELYARFSPELLAVTLGPDGCLCRTAAGLFSARTYDTPCVDTTGAGDAFWGAVLSWLLEHGGAPSALPECDVRAMMDFGNAAGSLTATKKGAIPAMPTRAEIEACMRGTPRLVR